jgi:hypothetical protein
LVLKAAVAAALIMSTLSEINLTVFLAVADKPIYLPPYLN